MPEEYFDRPGPVQRVVMLDDIPTEGRNFFRKTREQKERLRQAAAQKQQEVWLEKYPNAPREYITEAGQHLDWMFADPAGFFAQVAVVFNQQGGGQPSMEYAQTIRNLTVDSIPIEHYQHMFNALDLNHVNFVIHYIYPEHWEYLNERWTAGPDNRIEEWITNQVNNIKNLVEVGSNEEIEAARSEVVRVLDKFAPDFLKNIPKKLSIEFLQNVTPEIIDAIDKAAMDTSLQEENAKTVMLFAGGIAAVVLAFSFMTGRRPRGAPGTINSKK